MTTSDPLIRIVAPPHPTERCGSCGRTTRPALGVYLKLIANGRTICSGCGRFQVYCPCSRIR